MLGNEVVTLVDAMRDKGQNLVNFDASMLDAGIYFYRISVSNQLIQVKWC